MSGKKIRFGVVGAGLWGEAHAEVYAVWRAGVLEERGLPVPDPYQGMINRDLSNNQLFERCLAEGKPVQTGLDDGLAVTAAEWAHGREALAAEWAPSLPPD